MIRDKYYITFGQQSTFRDHYIIVYAENEQVATKIAEDKYKFIAHCYKESEFEVKYFPGGILEIVK